MTKLSINRRWGRICQRYHARQWNGTLTKIPRIKKERSLPPWYLLIWYFIRAVVYAPIKMK